MADALAYFAEYSPGALDVILDVIESVGRVPDREADEEPFCITCQAPLEMFAADGPYYRDYHGTEGGDAHRYSADHQTVIGWHRPTRP